MGKYNHLGVGTGGTSRRYMGVYRHRIDGDYPHNNW
jgi:hypothetical protein